MGWLGPDGYLNLNLNIISVHTINIINTVFLSISLSMQCAICITAVIKMIRSVKTSRRFGACFLVTSISGCLHTLTSLSWDVVKNNIYSDSNQSLLWLCFRILNLQSFGMFYLSILCTFILKLYFSFRLSAFEMSLNMIRLFSVIVFMIFVLNLTVNILFSISFFGVVFDILIVLGAILWIIGMVLAAWYFVTNLIRLAKQQSSWDLNMMQNDSKLNPNQQELVDLVTRSMLVFAIQMGSTIVLVMILGAAVPALWTPPFISIDIIINLLCSYCQFAFAQKHYRKCCGFCDNKFQNIMLDWIRKRIFRQSLSGNQAERHMADIQSMATPDTASSEGSKTPSAGGTVSPEAPESSPVVVMYPSQESEEPEAGEERPTWNMSNMTGTVDEQNIAKNMAMDWKITISKSTPYPNNQRHSHSEHLNSNDLAANPVDPKRTNPDPPPVIIGNVPSFKPQNIDITMKSMITLAVIAESAVAHQPSPSLTGISTITPICSNTPISSTTARRSSGSKGNSKLSTMAMAATPISEGSMTSSVDETIGPEAPETPLPV